VGEDFAVASGAIGELFWQIDEGVVVCRPDRLLACNPAAQALLGLEAPEAAREDADLGRVLGEALGQFWEIVRSGSGRSLLDCRGGKGCVLQATAWRLGGDAAGPTVVILRDVTHDRRQVTALRRLNIIAREVLTETSLDPVLARLVDAAKELTRADFSALLVLREGREDEVVNFVYNAPRELFPERLPRVVGLLAAPIASRSVARIDDIRGHPAGVGIPVEHPPIGALLAVPVLLGEQVVAELAVANTPDRESFDDVDEAMLSELAAHAALGISMARMRAAQDQAQSTRAALRDVSLHDIRTPLTIVRGFVATIRSFGHELSDEERSGAFHSVEQALDRIQELAEGALLDEPAGRCPVKTDLVEVTGLLDQLRADLSGYRKDVLLNVTMEEGCCKQFLGDRRLVRELLDNLVTNAMKHSPAGEAVTVTARPEGASIRFDVTDRGPGIPPDEQARVFDHFYRTRQSVADGKSGTGLGLWIVHLLAELHGGVVGVASRGGEGSTFWATIPVEPIQRIADVQR
jgi:signal transduction histidine kinase